jgi:hypothetical protein
MIVLGDGRLIEKTVISQQLVVWDHWKCDFYPLNMAIAGVFIAWEAIKNIVNLTDDFAYGFVDLYCAARLFEVNLC